MHTKYLPTDLEGKLHHVTEECGEVLKLIGKSGRFSLLGYHPDTLEVNIIKLDEELSDLTAAIKRLQEDEQFTALQIEAETYSKGASE